MPKKFFYAVYIFISLLFFLPTDVKAEISGCSVTVTPQSYNTGVPGTLTFGITNEDSSSNSILWVKITSPSSNFVISSIQGQDQVSSSISDGGSDATAQLSGLPQGGYGEYYVTVTTGDSVVSAQSFSVQVSDDVNGSNPTSCTGNTEVSITSAGQDVVQISDTTVSVNDNSATVSWRTSLNTTAEFVYGTSTSYGYTLSDSNFSTTHSFNITNLSSSTQYHFKIYSTDAESNTAQLADNTFTTSSSGETRTVTTTVTSTVTNSVREVYKDVILPSIKIKTELKKIYESFPSIDFVASDESGISRLRYSVDNGSNWFPINIEDKIGKKQIASSFTPSVTDDGEYTLIIEVTDAAGNKSFSKELKTTIDRLPPIVGPLIVMSGPQIINLNSSNNLDLIVDVEYKFILTSAGGPKTINMFCGGKTYNFEKNIDTGVWVTKIRFEEADKTCDPVIKAIDGADNVQEKNGNKIFINKRGILKNGIISVYWYDAFESKFVLWDASPYGQINPISTSATGGYAFLLPQGKYYIEAKAAGKRTTVSNIIDIKSAAIINDDWQLKPVWKFWQMSEEMIINPKILGSNDWNKKTTALPKLKLFSVNNPDFSTLDIRGGVSVVGLFTSWHPLANEYLKTLDRLNLNGVKSYPVLLQEKSAAANFLKLRGGYKLNIFADPDGEFLNEMDINGLPATLIVNKFGQVVYEKFGSISYQEVLDVISKIN